MNKSTISYYEKNAREYFEKTCAGDMAERYALLLARVPAGGRILDLGCGSGRDMKAFAAMGYEVYGLDACSNFCSLASEYSGRPVYQGDFLSWLPEDGLCFDGIWACASLLHLTEDELISYFRHAKKYLRHNGVICASFKTGVETGYDELGRFFTDFTDGLLAEILSGNSEYELLTKTHSEDPQGRTGFLWTNCVFSFRDAGTNSKEETECLNN